MKFIRNKKSLRKNRMAFKNNPNNYISINSDISVPSPIITEQESIDIKSITKDNMLSSNQKHPIEFENYTNSPKVRKKQDLNFSLGEIEQLIMNSSNNACELSSPQHNFLVTLCHQNKNLMKNSDNYMLEKSFESPKVSARVKKGIKRVHSYQIKDYNLTPPNEIYEEYSLAGSSSAVIKSRIKKRLKHFNPNMKLKPTAKPKIKKKIETHLSLDRSTLMDPNDQSVKVNAISKKQIEVNTENPIVDILK